MNQMQKDHSKDQMKWPAAAMQFFIEWLIVFFKGIAGMIGDARQQTQIQSQARQPLERASAPTSIHPFPIQKTMSGYITSGIRKMQRVQYSAAMRSEYNKIITTIKLTRRAIKSAPRSSRYLFEGYARLLEDATRKVELLNEHARIADEHLWRYDPRSLEQEIAQLESYLRRGSTENTRSETEGALAARRELLNSVQAVEGTLSSAAAQLRYIAATLELNHMRVVTIAARATRPSETDSEMLRARMEELTEQLALLEESIRELDGM
jgi:hypothetical protein